MTTGEETSRGFQNILVATDLSARAALAVERAARMARGPRSRLEILHVVPPGIASRKRTVAEADAQVALEGLAVSAKEVARASGNFELAVGAQVVTGQPFVEIIRSARASGANLLVLGRHGASPMRDLFSLGSTAERVIRKGDTPILVVSRTPVRPYRRPLVALDLSDAAPRILELALRAARSDVGRLSIVHAFHIPFEGFLYPSLRSRGAKAHGDELRQRATSALQKLVQRHGSDVEWKIAVRKGEPATVILSQIARLNADLLVLGTHGRAGTAHALLGSVAECVIRSAPCDVLVTRPARFSFELP